MTFDLFRISDDHEELRDAVRTLARDKIAVHAAAVDETESFPRDAYDALRAGDFHAPHIPAEYGGVGADALATCIVIEEVARACASSSLIPAVNKLGTMPLLLAGSEEVKRRYLPPVAAGEALISYALSEREAGSDTASMRTRARADGDEWVLNGTKAWITNAGESEFYTVLAVSDPEGRRGANVSAFVVERSDEHGDVARGVVCEAVRRQLRDRVGMRGRRDLGRGRYSDRLAAIDDQADIGVA